MKKQNEIFADFQNPTIRVILKNNNKWPANLKNSIYKNQMNL